MQSITKTSHELTLADRLSRLNFRQVCKLLGQGSEQLVQRGGRYDIDIAEHVTFNEDRFQLRFPTTTGNGHGTADVEVQIRPAADHRDYLNWECTACQIACELTSRLIAVARRWFCQTRHDIPSFDMRFDAARILIVLRPTPYFHNGFPRVRGFMRREEGFLVVRPVHSDLRLVAKPRSSTPAI